MGNSVNLEKKVRGKIIPKNENRTYTNEEVQNIKKIYKDYLKIRNAEETLPFEIAYRAAESTLPKMRKYEDVFKSEIEELSDLCEE